MSLPENREELRRRCAAGEVFDYYLFYGHKPPESGVDASCLSQWFVRCFRVDGVVYPTAEHWMMAEKARLFEDEAMLDVILEAATPREAKAAGRKVSGFDKDVWDEHKFQIVRRGNVEKFSQHEDMRRFLVETSSIESIPTRQVAEPGEDYVIAHPALGENSTQDEPQTQDSNVILVEAAGRDVIWGIGYSMKNPKAWDPFQWRGRNLLGFALTSVRESLRIQ